LQPNLRCRHKNVPNAGKDISSRIALPNIRSILGSVRWLRAATASPFPFSAFYTKLASVPRLLAIVAALALTASACASKGHSDLEDALSVAVKERKLSEKKREIILKEYDILRDEDKQKAKTYVEQVVKAVEMGGDSSHIDAVRRLAAGQRKGG